MITFYFQDMEKVEWNSEDFGESQSAFLLPLLKDEKCELYVHIHDNITHLYHFDELSKKSDPFQGQFVLQSYELEKLWNVQNLLWDSLIQLFPSNFCFFDTPQVLVTLLLKICPSKKKNLINSLMFRYKLGIIPQIIVCSIGSYFNKNQFIQACVFLKVWINGETYQALQWEDSAFFLS